MDNSQLPHHAAVDMLRRAREQFQMYGDHHMDKTPSQVAKASVNYMFVAEINSVLALLETPCDATDPLEDAFAQAVDQLVRSPDAEPMKGNPEL